VKIEQKKCGLQLEGEKARLKFASAEKNLTHQNLPGGGAASQKPLANYQPF